MTQCAKEREKSRLEKIAREEEEEDERGGGGGVCVSVCVFAFLFFPSSFLGHLRVSTRAHSGTHTQKKKIGMLFAEEDCTYVHTDWCRTRFCVQDGDGRFFLCVWLRVAVAVLKSTVWALRDPHQSPFEKGRGQVALLSYTHITQFAHECFFFSSSHTPHTHHTTLSPEKFPCVFFFFFVLFLDPRRTTLGKLEAVGRDSEEDC